MSFGTPKIWRDANSFKSMNKISIFQINKHCCQKLLFSLFFCLGWLELALGGIFLWQMDGEEVRVRGGNYSFVIPNMVPTWAIYLAFGRPSEWHVLSILDFLRFPVLLRHKKENNDFLCKVYANGFCSLPCLLNLSENRVYFSNFRIFCSPSCSFL